MTAAELASFRALLRDQAAAPSRPDRSLFERMRSRLTVVEGGAPAHSDAPAREAPSAAPRPATGLGWSAMDDVLADPPPSEPPLFGRRSCDEPKMGAPVAHGASAASRRFEPPCTPDGLDDPRAPPARRDGPAPGLIAGWSRARPPSAQRRLLGRLEAVLLAEREGLDARRAADSPQL